MGTDAGWKQLCDPVEMGAVWEERPQQMVCYRAEPETGGLIWRREGEVKI